MGKLTIGPKGSLNALGSPIKQSKQDKVQVMPEPIERIVERLIEVPVEVVREVEKRVEVLVDRPVEVIKEVEKLVEVKIPHIQFKTPKWAYWAILVAVLETVALALILSGQQ